MTEEAGAESKSLTQQVEDVLDTIRPFLQADGGDIDLVGVEDDGTVHVRLQGACVGCPSATMTLAMGVERRLKEQVPGVTAVVPV